MNRKLHHLTFSILSGALLLASSLPAAAADSSGARIATGVGRVIAAQGNVALVRIREELKDNLLETLKPLLPNEQNQAQVDEPKDVASSH